MLHLFRATFESVVNDSLYVQHIVIDDLASYDDLWRAAIESLVKNADLLRNLEYLGQCLEADTTRYEKAYS